MNVQSLETAKINIRETLDAAYQLIYYLFLELNCDQSMILSSAQFINDEKILFYLAAVESRLQQLLSTMKINRKGGGSNGSTGDTTISWRIDHRNIDQAYNSLLSNATRNNRCVSDDLRRLDSITPHLAR